MRFDENYKCAFYQNGKLCLIIGKGLLVMKAWPPAAWYRPTPAAPWQHIRPEFFDLAMKEPLSRLNRLKRREPKGAWELYEQYGAAALSLGESQDSQDEPEHIGAILARLAANRYLTLFVPDQRFRLLAELKPLLPQFMRVDKELQAFQTFYTAIPEEVRAAVTPFPVRHYSLVSFCARCPGALDLVRSTPALAFMLANCWVFGRKVTQPLRSCRALLKKTQPRQLEWLGFPNPGKSTVRILRKVPVECCTPGLLVYLRQALGQPDARKCLEHLPRINRGVVRIVSDPKLLPHVSSALLEQVGNDGRERIRPRIGKELLWMLDLYDHEHRKETVFLSKEKYDEFRKLIDDMDFHAYNYPVGGIFPRPPSPGNAWLHPITTFTELDLEGKTQHHCILSLAGDIYRGKAYTYKVLLPNQRATLLVRKPAHAERWQVAECRAAHNTCVPANVLQHINTWLTQSQAAAHPMQAGDHLEQSQGCEPKDPNQLEFQF